MSEDNKDIQDKDFMPRLTPDMQLVIDSRVNQRVDELTQDIALKFSTILQAVNECLSPNQKIAFYATVARIEKSNRNL